MQRRFGLLILLTPVLLIAQSYGTNGQKAIRKIQSLNSMQSALYDPMDSRITVVPKISVESTNAQEVGLYERFEAILLLEDAIYQNPYDPEEIDIRAVFVSPSERTWEIFGFYDDYQNRDQWKVRFSPNETGTWHYTLYVSDLNGADTSEVYTFEAVQSGYHGWLRVSPDNPYYLIYDDGTSFYGVGPAYPWGVNNGSTGLAQLEASGANLFYYWNGTYDMGYGLIESINSGLGRYDQPKCGRIDQILEWSEERGLKMVLSIWPHDYLSYDVWSNPRWDVNPYNQICDVINFYGNEEAWTYQLKQYRYIIARWAYSRSMGVWESVCEINGTDGWVYGDQSDALDWVENFHNFFRENDPYHRPTTISQGGGQYWSDGYALTDLPNVHMYETQAGSPHYPQNPMRSSLWVYGSYAGRFRQDFEKPGVFGEAGYMDNYGDYSAGSSEYVEMYHNALWVTWASGLAATPLWWDFGTKSIFTSELMAQMLAFSKGVKMIDYAHLSFGPSEAEVEDCDVYAMAGDSLAFGWIRETEGEDVSNKTFMLDGVANAPYSILWIDTWTGDTVRTNSRIGQDGVLTDYIPQLSQNVMDVAFVIHPAQSGDIPWRLELTANPIELYSSSLYSSQIVCYVLDAEDRICTQAENPITFVLEGPGALEGTNPVAADQGMANIIFRANQNAGNARIIASSAGLIPDTINVLIKKHLYIDNFEEYMSNADLEKIWQKRYGTDVNLFLESSSVEEGQHSMRMEYSIGNGSLSYAGIFRDIIGNWSEAKSLAFWLDPDGSGRLLDIRLYIDGSRYWYYDYGLNGSDSTTVAISFRKFKSNYGAASYDGSPFVQIAFNLYQGGGVWGSGTLVFDNIRFLSDDSTGVLAERMKQIPQVYCLYQNFPNPFNNGTVIRYAQPVQSPVKLTVYNIQGQVVDVLLDENQKAGMHEIHWNADHVGSGLYFYRLKTQNTVLTRKCVLVK